MSKVIMFSREFPAYHPKAGQSTYFVEKILNALKIDYRGSEYFESVAKLNPHINAVTIGRFCSLLNPEIKEEKVHTIRSGHRLNAPKTVQGIAWNGRPAEGRTRGDKFSPRVWLDKPYRSKQITFASDVQVKHTWDFRTYDWGDSFNHIEIAEAGHAFSTISNSFLDQIAKNDGLIGRQDLLDWIKYPTLFDGQIICWNEKIDY